MAVNGQGGAQRALEHDMAAVRHQDNLVEEFGGFGGRLVNGDEDGGPCSSRAVPQRAQDQDGRVAVQAVRRAVDQQDARVGDEFDGDRHPASLSAAQRADRRERHGFQLQFPKNVRDARRDRSSGQGSAQAKFQREGERLPDGR